MTDEYKIIENVEKPILIELSDISSANYKIFRSLAPYGTGFKEPTFLIKDLPTKSLKFISGGKHLSTPLTIKTKLLGFNMSEIDIKEHKLINIYGNFSLSTYQNKETLEFRINKYDYID